MSLVAEASGSYRLEMRSLEKNAKVGRYEAKLVDLRTATSHDRSRVTAERLLEEAQQSFEQKTADSRRKALEKYEQSLPLWRAVGDRLMEANVLSKIARYYIDSGKKEKAIDYYNQALTLLRAANDRLDEANTLNALGWVYLRTGELQKAHAHFTQANALYQAANNRTGEAEALMGLGVAYGGLGDKQKSDEYRSLAEPQKTIDYLNQALQQRQAAGKAGGATNLWERLSWASTKVII